MCFKEKVHVVTGASSGIGRSCVEKLLESGAVVNGIDRQPSSVNNKLYQHFAMEITDEPGIEHIVGEISQKYGRIDGLVNATGRWGNSTPFYETETADWENVISVNLTGMFVV